MSLETFDSVELLDVLIRRHPHPFLLLSSEGRIRMANQALCDWFGIASEDAPDTDLTSIAGVDNAKLFLEPFRQEDARRGTQTARRQLFCPKTERLRDVEISWTMVVDPERGVLVSFRELEESGFSEADELLRRLADIESGSRAKSEFLANMSHEIRTPINGIVGMAELAIDSEDRAERRQCLQHILTCSNTLVDLVNDILDLSRIEAGRLEIEEESFDLPKCLGEIVNEMRPRAEAQGLQFVASVSRDLPEGVHSDRTRLKQVLYNLLGNAIKFTEAGRIEFTAATMKTEGGTAVVRFVVSDTGVGIPEENRTSIFNKFAQGSVPANKEQGGAGLGLAIARELVELMGGSIWFESRMGAGATFYVKIPFGLRGSDARGSREGAGPANIPGEKKAGPSRPLKILLVEDNPVNQQLCILRLRKLGHDLTVAWHGLEAVKEYEKNDFDLILMDVQMPVMDGFETTRKIREIEKTTGRRTTIVAMTARAMKGDEQLCLDSGMDAYLAKPFRADKLAAILESVAGEDSIGNERTSSATIPNLSVLRSAYGVGDDIEDLKLLSEMYTGRFQNDLASIRAAFESSDARAFIQRVHGLKGVFDVFGAEQARESAKSIEMAARRDFGSVTSESIDRLEREATALKEALRKFVDSAQTPTGAASSR